MPKSDVLNQPVSAAVLHILLALSQKSRHGYGIIKEVERQTAGQYRLGPGTLYDNLKKLIDYGLVEDIPPDGGTDSKRTYRISSSGAGVLAAELKTLEGVLRIGKKRLRSLRAAESA